MDFRQGGMAGITQLSKGSRDSWDNSDVINRLYLLALQSSFCPVVSNAFVESILILTDSILLELTSLKDQKPLERISHKLYKLSLCDFRINVISWNICRSREANMFNKIPAVSNSFLLREQICLEDQIQQQTSEKSFCFLKTKRKSKGTRNFANIKGSV